MAAFDIYSNKIERKDVMTIQVGHSRFLETAYTQQKAKYKNEQENSSAAVDTYGSAFNVSISKAALERYNQEKSEELTLQQDVSFFKTPEKGVFRAEKRDELPVKTVFREGTIENFIMDALDGKVENSYETALQLGELIFSGQNNKDANTSAIDRETGKKLAEYISQNYFDDPNEAQSFLDGITDFSEKSEMRDKGYTVIIGSDIEPFKPKFNDLQRFAEEKFGYTDVDWSDTEKSSKIVRAFTLEAMSLAQKETKNSHYNEESLPSLLNHDSNPFMYKEEKAALNKAFVENEKKVQGMIDDVKNIVSEVAVNNDFFGNLHTTLFTLNQSQAARLSDILSMFETTLSAASDLFD